MLVILIDDEGVERVHEADGDRFVTIQDPNNRDLVNRYIRTQVVTSGGLPVYVLHEVGEAS